METSPSYKPSVFYFRRALRCSDSHQSAIEVGLVVCSELEMLKQWVRDQGMIPPKFVVHPSEAQEKGWEVAS